MSFRSINWIKNLKGKRVLTRVDFNVPVKGGRIIDDTKIRAAEKTIRYLVSRGGRIILISHFGEPKRGKKGSYSLRNIAKELTRILKRKIVFLKDKVGSSALKKKVLKLRAGEIALLENIRFYKEEEAGDLGFARKLAELGEIFVQEAFSVCHRNHASVSKVYKFLPSFAGFQLEEEIKNLSRLLPQNLKSNNRPYVALLGGVKISTKIKFLSSLLKMADYVLVGGALAHHFLAAQKFNLGKSFLEKKYISIAKKMLKNRKLILPVDFVVSKKMNKAQDIRVAELCDIKKNEIIVDIGPRTIRQYAEILKKAKTIAWNGPMGLFEVPEFSYGSLSLATLIAALSKGRVFGAVGGGETIACLSKTAMSQWVDWVSMGGGAMLAYLAGEKMPGLQ